MGSFHTRFANSVPLLAVVGSLGTMALRVGFSALLMLALDALTQCSRYRLSTTWSIKSFESTQRMYCDVNRALEASPENPGPCHLNGRSATGETVRKFKDRIMTHCTKVAASDLSKFNICDPVTGVRNLPHSDLKTY